MKARRYKEQYRIRTGIDPKSGRERRMAQYAGQYCAFPAGTPDAKGRALRLAVPIALYWLLALAYLKTAGATGRCIYALVPYLLGLFPGVYALMGLFAMVRAPKRMTVVQRENGVGRALRSALGCGVFAALGTLGAIVCLCADRLWAGAWHEPLLMAASAAAGFAAFTLARRDFHSLEILR